VINATQDWLLPRSAVGHRGLVTAYTATDQPEELDFMSVKDIIDGLLEDLNLLVPTTVDPFPSAISLALDTSNSAFNTCSNTGVSDPKVSDLCGAAVDLTADPSTPVYAGHNDSDMVFVGSMGKIYAMYAAFELRLRVEV